MLTIFRHMFCRHDVALSLFALSFNADSIFFTELFREFLFWSNSYIVLVSSSLFVAKLLFSRYKILIYNLNTRYQQDYSIFLTLNLLEPNLFLFVIHSKILRAILSIIRTSEEIVEVKLVMTYDKIIRINRFVIRTKNQKEKSRNIIKINSKMFSFHKPKVYRSSTGCCICKAKSSSSRFTDSKKYEDDFIECFQLEERRTGEICNACVLLVKRWKKLPAGSDRNWRHVVDARAGPGIKSLTKFKSRNKKKIKDAPEKFEKILKKKHVNLKTERDREQSPAMSDDLTEEYLVEIGSKGSSRSGSPAGSDDIGTTDKQLVVAHEDSNTKNELTVNGFIDLSYFKREIICCGTIFKGQYGEVIVDPSLIKPCLGCIGRQRQQQTSVLRRSPLHSSASASPVHSSASASPAHSVESGTESTVSKQTSKTFSDSSSDSGYDESSNQGVGESKITKIIQSTGPLKTAVKIQPIKSVQLKAIPVSEAVRLKTDVPIKLVPIKQIDQLSCKPLSLVSSANVTLSSSTSHTVVTVPTNPLVDFAVHAASSRQSVSN